MVCFAEVTHFDTVVAFVLPDQEFLFQRIQVFRHKDELPSGRILAFMILHGQAFFYPSVSTFIIASESKDKFCPHISIIKKAGAVHWLEEYCFPMVWLGSRRICVLTY